MTRRKKLVIGVGAAAVALLGVGGAAGAIAASGLLSPEEQSKAVIDDAAQQLGVEPQALSDALKQALKNRVDEAVEAGRLTQEQGDELKERIDSDEYPMLLGPWGHFGRGFGPALDFGFEGGDHLHFDVLDAAAAYLGMTEAQLAEALKDKTLAQIAEDKGKSVDGLVQALVAAQEKRIDQAVADGRITAEQAADLKAKFAEFADALVNGELPRLGEEKPSHLWRGSGSPRGPPALFGPIA